MSRISFWKKMADGVTGKKVRKHPSRSEGVFSKNLSGSLRINIMRTAASIIFCVIPDIAKRAVIRSPSPLKIQDFTALTALRYTLSQ